MGEKSKLVEGDDFYVEGAAIVFTARYHLRRGHCCANGCRHCPYDASENHAADAGERRRFEDEVRS